MVYLHAGSNIFTFVTQFVNILCLHQDGGGVYKVLTAEKVLRTSHVQSKKRKFTGFQLLQKTNPLLYISDEEVQEV